MPPELIYSTPFFLASIAILVVAVFIFIRRTAPGAWYLIMLCMAGAFWATCEGMLYLGMEMAANIRITSIQYLGIATVIPLALIFTLSTFGFQHWVNTFSITTLMAAATIIVLVWTNASHQLVFSHFFRIDEGPVPMLGIDHGPLWWVIIGYHYALTGLMSAILIRTVYANQGARRSQAGVVLAAIGVIWLANAIYVMGKSPVANMDLGPLAFIFVAFSLAWGFFKYDLLQLLPIAKALIFKALSDPIIVTDEKRRIIDMNPAAEKQFNLKASDAIARNFEHIFDKHPQFKGILDQDAARQLTLHMGEGPRFFDLRRSTIRDKTGKQIGQILIFQDVTENKLANETLDENERMQGVLEMAGAVCHDLNQPVAALLKQTDRLESAVSGNHALYPKVLKLAEQANRLRETTLKLTGITRYETREYLRSKIVDIDKSSADA